MQMHKIDSDFEIALCPEFRQSLLLIDSGPLFTKQ